MFEAKYSDILALWEYETVVLVTRGAYSTGIWPTHALRGICHSKFGTSFMLVEPWKCRLEVSTVGTVNSHRHRNEITAAHP